MAIGRISGPLLKANLVRDGVDLAFETDLLYLDVNNSRIGINTASPQYELDISGTAKTTDLEVTNQLDVGNFTITGNTISSDQPVINFIASGGEATAYHSRLVVNDLEFNGNTISTTASNANLELRANGTGKVDILSRTDITGNLNVTGNHRKQNYDRTQIRHIFTNLISNALKYSEGSVDPEVIIKYNEDSVILEVRDHGIGIPVSEIPHLFTSFYRASNTSNIQGTGLGLVIVKQLVEMHSGRIFYRKPEGQGSLFVVEFPNKNKFNGKIEEDCHH